MESKKEKATHYVPLGSSRTFNVDLLEQKELMLATAADYVKCLSRNRQPYIRARQKIVVGRQQQWPATHSMFTGAVAC